MANKIKPHLRKKENNMIPKFKNTPNKSYHIGGKEIWHSRSAAVNLAILIWTYNLEGPYVLASKRGPTAADNRGKMNLVAGYFDWDESGEEAIYRETWEECGIYLPDIIKSAEAIISNDLDNPWYTNTKPTENRQNISLRYGIAVILKTNELPALSTEYNEQPGEVEDPMWIPIEDIHNYQWAFNHDQVILDYFKRIEKIIDDK